MTAPKPTRRDRWRRLDQETRQLIVGVSLMCVGLALIVVDLTVII